jgi:hypothetical protein
MWTWLRSLVNALLGKVPGGTSRPDTATLMAMDADFGDRQESMPHGLRRRRARDDGHLIKPTGSLADFDPVEELIRVVSEAQERDDEDERRLYLIKCAAIDPHLLTDGGRIGGNEFRVRLDEVPSCGGLGHLLRRPVRKHSPTPASKVTTSIRLGT